MRVCLEINDAFETMTTTSSSEQILSEAAYFVIQRAKGIEIGDGRFPDIER